MRYVDAGGDRDWRDICYTCFLKTISYIWGIVNVSVSISGKILSQRNGNLSVSTVVLKGLPNESPTMITAHKGVVCLNPKVRFKQSPCEVKTTRGHQCTYPCKPGGTMCLRHLNCQRQADIFNTVKHWFSWYIKCSRMLIPTLWSVRFNAIERSSPTLWSVRLNAIESSLKRCK